MRIKSFVIFAVLLLALVKAYRFIKKRPLKKKTFKVN